MQHAWSRRAAVRFTISSLAALAIGCTSSNDIPLVKFPDNMPPPPTPGKSDGKGPQGANTSSGDPSNYTK